MQGLISWLITKFISNMDAKYGPWMESMQRRSLDLGGYRYLKCHEYVNHNRLLLSYCSIESWFGTFLQNLPYPLIISSEDPWWDTSRLLEPSKRVDEHHAYRGSFGQLNLGSSCLSVVVLPARRTSIMENLTFLCVTHFLGVTLQLLELFKALHNLAMW